MLAPRRIGKTVLLNRLQETAIDNGFRAIVVDVEGFPEPERTRLYEVLDIVARNEEGADSDILLTGLNRGGETVGRLKLRELLDTLSADGYLTRGDDGRYRFRMNLLREWWLRYVVL